MDFSSLVPFWLWMRWRTWMRREKSVGYFAQRVLIAALLAAFVAIEVAWYRAGETWAFLIVGGIALLIAAYCLAIGLLAMSLMVMTLVAKTFEWTRPKEKRSRPIDLDESV